ncbi:MAG: tyrosine--tRNA ligase, partial [Actinomycetota bacterium]
MATFGDVVTEFASRGLIHDSTDRQALSQRSTSAQMTAYVGFDPTSDSLHAGNLLGQISLRRFQLLGHRPIVLAGGATGMVGDPSGRSEERNLLDADTLASNVANITSQLERLLDFDAVSNAATLVDNADWTRNVPVLEFLRDVGKHITVNQMMAKDSVKSRLADENGLSYTEFSYMLLQANDFRHLCEHHDCEMQMGGSDQWGNITAGIDLIRKRLGRSAYGLTWPLLTKSDGTKFGKTADGAVWLDAKKTSPYQFRQFWVQIADDDIERYLPQFSLKSLDDISVLLDEQRANPAARPAQRALADELTALV